MSFDPAELAFPRPRLHSELQIKTVPDDFIVIENLGISPEGEGEHLWLSIEKTGLETEQVSKRLAHFFAVARRQVSYSGLKDKHAVTQQWFSVQLPQQNQDAIETLDGDGLRVLEAKRHRRKLQRGTHKSNSFIIKLRAVDLDAEPLQTSLDELAVQGFPNYFMQQRLGEHGEKVKTALAALNSKKRLKKPQQGFYISVLRSALFNSVLHARIESGLWGSAMPGDVLQLNGSHSVFAFDPDDPALPERLQSGDVHLTGPLYGRGASVVKADAASWEAQILEPHTEIMQCLENCGAKPMRRALRVIPQDLAWSYSDQVLQLSFSLPPGAYATALIASVIAAGTP